MTTPETATVFSLKEKLNYVKDSVVNQQITKGKGSSVILFAFDKDQQLKEHSAPVDAVVQVLEGKAKIHIAGKPFEVREGEVIILPADVPHAVYATEAFKMLLIR